MDLNKDVWEKSMVGMMAGKLAKDPFSIDHSVKGRAFLTSWCTHNLGNVEVSNTSSLQTQFGKR